MGVPVLVFLEPGRTSLIRGLFKGGHGLNRRVFVFIAALGLVMSSIGIAAGAKQQRAERKYSLRDGEVTSAAETGPDQGQEAVDGVADDQHGDAEGHLPATRRNMKLVSKLRLTETEGAISDVNYGNGHAYLGAYHPSCNELGEGGGVHVVDVRDPRNPQEVGFIPSPIGNYVSEGVDFLRTNRVDAETGKRIRQDLLLTNNEPCADTSISGGINIYDVTNPRDPVPLSEGVGDFGEDPTRLPARANYTHSVFGWNDDGRSFAVLVDDEEALDVDIMDITDPAAPVLIAETGLPDWPDAKVNGLGKTAFHHDVFVKQINGVHYMQASYWDAGQVLLNVERPRNPVFIDDSNFPTPDTLTGKRPPEGNAHQGNWSSNNEFFIQTDEDFGPYRIIGLITSGLFEDTRFESVQGNNVPQISDDLSMIGPTYYVGLACDTTTSVPAAQSEDDVAIVQRGECSFTEKAQNVQEAGYQGGIVFNRTGEDACEQLVNMDVQADIPFIFVARSTGFKILNVEGYKPEECGTENEPELPDEGTQGNDVSVTAKFDGWGYVRLLDAQSLKEIDAYAVDESLDPAFAFNSGALSVHEVKTDERRGVNLGYLSYYAAGARVISFGDSGIKEMGVFIDKGGNDFWGVFPIQRGNDRPLILESDRDFGLYVLEYTGPEPGAGVRSGPCSGYEEGSRTDRDGGGKVIVGTEGDDTLAGTTGNDIICGRGGDDIIDGLGGRDEIVGNEGDDTITGGGGKDTIRGNADQDAIDGNEGNDVILGGSGNDSLRGNGGWDTLRGGRGPDTLQGGEGNDVLRGGPQDDTLKGFEGDDILNGDAGTDSCDGGTGRNTLRSCEG